MALVTVSDLEVSGYAKFETKGQTVEGFFMGSKEVKTPKGDQILHVIRTETGDQIGVNGSFKLNQLLSQIPFGHFVVITFEGKITLKNKNTLKKFSVQWDDERSVSVGETVSTFTKTNSLDDVEESYEEEEDSTTQQPNRAIPPRNPRVVSSDSKNQVQSLLGRRR